jgi:uncharacterized protein (DUF1800 family)
MATATSPASTTASPDTSALRSELAHLYRRAGFGATPAELDAALARGYPATVEHLLDLGRPDPAADGIPVPAFTSFQAATTPSTTPTTKPAAKATTSTTTHDRQALNRQLHQEGVALASWWLQRMVASQNPLREKLTLLWHGHFATAIQKVKLAGLMYRQNQLFRSLGGGNFEALTQAVAKDPAMLLWLDSNTNRSGHPNENFARELMELFTLGIGNYTETDVKEAARCFTGWTYSRQTDGFAFQARRHDDGSKQVLGVSGNLGGEDVIRLVTNTPVSAAWITSRLFSHLAYPVAPSDSVVRELTSAYAGNLDITALLRAIFLHPAFLSPAARQGLVKQPIEYVVGVLRAFSGSGSTTTSPTNPANPTNLANLANPANPKLLATLTQLGQVPFDPPNVGGWPQNGYWLTTATELARLNFAAAVAVRVNLEGIGDADALAKHLSIDGWSPQTRRVLNAAATPQQRVALALTAPEYVLN